MIISYDMLWVDDQIEDDAMQHAVGKVVAHLEKHGFKPNIQKCLDAEEAKKHLESKPDYDLILSDYNLIASDDKKQDAGNGNVLIKSIRKERILTEVLFYSGQGNFDDIAKNLAIEQIDRVSFLSLATGTGESYDGLVEKTIDLINLTVKKLQEIKNLQGLIIGAVSQLDKLVHSKIEEIFKNSDISGEIKKFAHRKVSERAEKISQKEEKISTENIAEKALNDHFLLDASMKSQILSKYLKIKGWDNFQYTNGYPNFHERYRQEASLIRNTLAHNAPEVPFGAERCIGYRIKINKLYELIESLKIT